MREIARNPEDKTQVSLLFANIGVEDILLRAELDELAAKSEGRIKVHYIVEKPTDDAGVFAISRTTPELISTVMPPPADDVLVCICGPYKMLEAVCGGKDFPKGKPPQQGPIGGMLKDMGYSESMVFKF